MALPPLRYDKTWKRFLLSVFLIIVGIYIPLWFTILSAVRTPSSKAGVVSGWLECIAGGLLALLPILFWACASFYVAQILKPKSIQPPWIVLGLFAGAITHTALTGIRFAVFRDWGPVWEGLLSIPQILLHPEQSASFSRMENALLFLDVPLFNSIWYWVLALQAMKQSPLSPLAYLGTFAGSLPFWGTCLYWAYTTYEHLPEHSEGCFIVTAAGRGHRWCVGPFSTVMRRGVARPANRQLRTFWAFEAFWQHTLPRTHAAFRVIYNRVGPFVARRIRNPYVADAVWLALKPCEYLAACILRMRP